MTLFIWTPRIGQLAGSKDRGMIDYYKSRIEAHLDFDLLAGGLELAAVPEIASTFTDWRYQRMRNVIDFCV